MIVWALSLTLAAAAAVKRTLTTLRQSEDPTQILPDLMEHTELNRIHGYGDYLGWELGIREKIAAT